MNSRDTCRYRYLNDGESWCKKISEKLLGMKGCGEYQERSPFDEQYCPTCGKRVIDKAHAVHECIGEGQRC